MFVGSPCWLGFSRFVLCLNHSFGWISHYSVLVKSLFLLVRSSFWLGKSFFLLVSCWLSHHFCWFSHLLSPKSAIFFAYKTIRHPIDISPSSRGSMPLMALSGSRETSADLGRGRNSIMAAAGVTRPPSWRFLRIASRPGG